LLELFLLLQLLLSLLLLLLQARELDLVAMAPEAPLLVGSTIWGELEGLLVALATWRFAGQCIIIIVLVGEFVAACGRIGEVCGRIVEACGRICCRS
jgi:hypothetical protein